jgi:putative phosphatase
VEERPSPGGWSADEASVLWRVARIAGMNRGKAALMLPDAYVHGIAEISLDKLSDAGIHGIIVDLDNTLVAYRESVVAPEVVAWVEAALARGFRVVLVSNNFEERVASIGTRLGVPTVPRALKPLPGGLLRALRILGTKKRQTVVVGDQLLTDVVAAKLAGMHSILIEPISEHGFITTRMLRVVERFVLRVSRMRP